MFEAVAKLCDRAFGEERDAGRNILTVRLLFRAAAPTVRLELSAPDTCPEKDCTLQPLIWEVPYREFAPNAEARFDLTIPESLVEDLHFRLAQGRSSPDEPLWLKLVRPYGMLGTLHWEGALNRGLGRPILRLPESPHRASERTDVLENAIIVDPGSGADPDDVRRRVDETIKAILGGSNRSATHVHIFTRADWFDRLKGLAADERIRIYDPGEAATSFEMARSEWAPGPALRAGVWAKWIGESLAGRGLDALHLVCRCRDTQDGAVLMLSCSPSPREEVIDLAATERKVPSAAIEDEELKLLLDRSGAWAVSFLPSEPERSRQMAYVADSFAHRRGGAVLFAALTGPRHDPSLAAAFRLLFGASRMAPAMTDGFLYCHPSLVGADFSAASPNLLAILADHAVLLAQRAPLTQRLLRFVTRFIPGLETSELTAPPPWLASTQRFLEGAALDEARRAAPDVLFSAPVASSAGWRQAIDASSDSVGANEAYEGQPSLEETAPAGAEPPAAAEADSAPGVTPEMAILAEIQAVVADYAAREEPGHA